MPEIMDYERLRAICDDSTLVVRGAFACNAGDGVPPVQGEPAACLVLLGAAGRRGFDGFRGAPESAGGRGSLDRFSERVIDALAARLGARALYPHRGPPWWPIQRWAARAGPVHPSPLGILIHPRFGLWHAYRGALALPWIPEGLAPPPGGDSPCLSCDGQPCLRACPVSAFDGSAYRVDACARWLAGPDGRGCLEGGCRARDACPAGREHRYPDDQVRFHMRAFARARGVVVD